MHENRIAVGTLFATALVALAGCFGGDSKQKDVLHFEAENRATDAGACALDGERVSIQSIPTGEAKSTASRPTLLFPANGCWAEWSLTLPKALPLALASARPPAGPAPQCVVWTVHVDDTRMGATAPHCASADRWTWVDRTVLGDATTEPARLAKGTHTIRITMSVVEGPTGQDGYLDTFRFFE